MTKSDLPQTGHPSDGAVLLRRALLGFGGGITLVFIAGMIAGFTSVVIEHGGPDLTDIAILAAMLLAGAAVGYGMWRFWPRSSGEPEAPRIKSARKILIAVMILGVPIGILLGMSDDSAMGFLSNSPVNPTMALITLVIWLIPVPLLTWLWWRRVDEHEANAYRDGALIAAHAYLFITPAWWLGTRAGWFPQQDPMIVLLLVSVVWSIAWFVKKYG